MIYDPTERKLGLNYTSYILINTPKYVTHASHMLHRRNIQSNTTSKNSYLLQTPSQNSLWWDQLSLWGRCRRDVCTGRKSVSDVCEGFICGCRSLSSSVSGWWTENRGRREATPQKHSAQGDTDKTEALAEAAAASIPAVIYYLRGGRHFIIEERWRKWGREGGSEGEREGGNILQMQMAQNEDFCLYIQYI